VYFLALYGIPTSSFNFIQLFFILVYTVKRHFYAREKIMRIGQNGPIDKCTRFLFMCLNVPCIAMYGAIKIYARQLYATAA
jgi:hypothetical protein